MKTWEDNEFPLAYLITFRTYGTWLHGDKRTSVDRSMNIYGTPRIPERIARENYAKSILNKPPVELNAKQRNGVEKTIREVCRYKNWGLYSINVRTNHAHAVIAAGASKPGKIINALKAYSTRRLREDSLWTLDTSPWVDKGSERWLWDEESVQRACDYVIYCQGPDLTDFDTWKTTKNPPADAGGSA
jgi:REP element-mobilizing transposase RayT